MDSDEVRLLRLVQYMEDVGGITDDEVIMAASTWGYIEPQEPFGQIGTASQESATVAAQPAEPKEITL